MPDTEQGFIQMGPIQTFSVQSPSAEFIAYSQFLKKTTFNIKNCKKVFFPSVPLRTGEIQERGAMFFLKEVLTYTWQYLYLSFAGPFPVRKKKKSFNIFFMGTSRQISSFITRCNNQDPVDSPHPLLLFTAEIEWSDLFTKAIVEFSFDCLLPLAYTQTL